MELRALQAADHYAANRSATRATGAASGDIPATLGAWAADFSETMRQGEETAKAAMVGKADPHALVEALAQAELAVETVVTVRDKVVEAYQEILRMPV